ncbi:hypothetical protein HMPREF0083_00831 [Aneurinibacillus aneurinilyticus ATCC 12856]|uniref:Uncharacterized protein n=1 Tax=Aneurinibacillus aneurinilyticus ATCC 12856 TaxID=649747 RepID=U1X7Y3_ANEAE|nr:hypothetical protein HMPREF0083_00831 [Aneurinibacillus aneurinilyticus ATCC 12856]
MKLDGRRRRRQICCLFFIYIFTPGWGKKWPCGPAWLGQKAVLYASGRETNRRPFGARCGGDLLWIILDNQHP